MEEAPRLVSTRLYCHNCQFSFCKLINPDHPVDLQCERCKSDFIEILDKNRTCPPDPDLPDPENSPSRHGRYAPFFEHPQIKSEIRPPAPSVAPMAPEQAPASAPTAAAPNVRIHLEERPNGFTYVMTGPSGSFHYQVYQTSNISPPPQPTAAPHPEEKKTASASASASASEEIKQPAEQAQHRGHWFDHMLSHHMPQYMNSFFSDAQGMGMLSGGEVDPFSPGFMGGMVFGNAFPGLRLHDFFSETDDLFPTQLGINLQDFGLNFASNFHHGNLIDLAQLLSMADYGNAGKPPASKDMVTKLPIFKIEDKHCKKAANGALETPTCAICCSNINKGEEAMLLPCGHMFHPECVKPWLNQHNTCPICRYELPTDDPYYEEIRKRNLSQQQQQRGSAASASASASASAGKPSASPSPPGSGH